MSCELCKKIWDSIDAYQGNFMHDWDEKIGIVTQWDKPWLYVPCEGDWYYSDAVMQINYCPQCGRKLIEDEIQKDVEYVIVGDTPEYKNCLVYVIGLSLEVVAEQVLNRMLNNPNENDKRLIKDHTNLRIEAVDKKDCWWNDNCD